MMRKILIAATVAGSLTVSGCAGNNGNDDMTGALLIGAAAIVGLGLLAATSGSDDDGYDSGRRGHHGHHRSGYDASDYRYANNGRCDDARYRTSNGGHASAGTDERDCRRFGDGLK